MDWKKRSKANTKDGSSDSEENVNTSLRAKSNSIHLRRFRDQWKDTFDWLEERNNSAFCVACKKPLSANLAHLRRHDGKIRHKKKMLEMKDMTSTVPKKNYFRERYAQRKSPVKMMKLNKDEMHEMDILAANLSNYASDQLSAEAVNRSISNQLEMLTAEENLPEGLQEDPLAHASKYSKIKKTASQCQVTKCTQTFSARTADEFSYFGLNIAAQLRKLPLHRALQLQTHFQATLTKERIKNC